MSTAAATALVDAAYGHYVDRIGGLPGPISLCTHELMVENLALYGRLMIRSVADRC